MLWWRLAFAMLALGCAGSVLAQAPVIDTQRNPAFPMHLLEHGSLGIALSGGQEDLAKGAAIRKLLGLMGLANIRQQVLDAVMPQLRPIVASAVPQAEQEKFINDFSQKFRVRFKEDDILEAEEPIYASHFSLEDIKALTQFYESPTGQRFVAELPEISRESQVASAQIGRKVLLDTFHAMSGDYPELKRIVPAE